jgi:hypothetical protein
MSEGERSLRPSLKAIAASCGVVILVAGLVMAHAQALGPWSGRERTGGPLETDDGEYTGTYSANVGEMVSYGQLAVYNMGREDVVLESAELLGPIPAEGVLVEGPETVPGGDELIAAERRYPLRFDPPKPPARPIAGTVVRGPDDASGIELIFKITPQRKGRYVWPGVRVHYRVGNKKYVLTDADDAFILCVPRVEFCEEPDGAADD